MPAKTVPGRKAGKDHARSQCPEKHPGTQGCLRQEASQVHRQRSTVLRTTVASVTLHVIKAKAKKNVLPVREKWDRHKEPVSPYFRFSSSRERSERLDIALSRSNGLSGERVHDLERSTVNHVLKRSAELLASSVSSAQRSRPRLMSLEWRSLFLRQTPIFQTLRLDRFFSKRQRIWG